MPTLTSAHHEGDSDGFAGDGHRAVRLIHDGRTNELLRAAARATGVEKRRLLDEVVVENLRLAEAVSRRYGGRGVEAEELQQVAYLGLVAAVHRFDPDRGNDFVGFALPTILGEIKRYFRDHGWAVRPPRRVQELRSSMAAASDELCQSLGRIPSDADLADHLGAELEEIREAEQSGSCYTAISIDRAAAPDADGDGSVLADALGGPDTGYDHAEAMVALSSACGALSARDRRILYLRFFCGWTQLEIGAELGITQMQVSRLLARILRRLRKSIGETAA
ncbi:SigB/SigF/SigG family RNA polymerase sigma factor [Jiangella aurantiaca]|uniref:SigB/SigF/SigG family RNA polymerase sigma factor n=1 Tax=Jiangella aurantiaca TaxID=2530373 RepID=A0A4R5A9A7_9ACTN|nr:SigB/SigF/SigG family RNA polymerase sigma factor [Jiangella aurantiaca]TDD68888.1 SigB/SigF/SigG family RNA polymerase sigma factor [Jiangella aurantiaca]